LDFTRVFRDVEIKEIIGKKDTDVEITGVTSQSEETDSKTVFVAICGRKFDGHGKIPDAVSHGCQVIVCEEFDGSPDNYSVLIVENSRKALAVISSNLNGKPSKKLKIIGITGTNGKTTTAYMLYHILNENGIKCALIGTLGAVFENTEYTGYTTPEPVLLQYYLKKAVDNGYTHVIAEVSSQALEQERVFGINFELGVFLNLSLDHLDYHGNMKSYGEAKLKLFSMSGKTLANADSDYSLPFVSYKGTKTFSLFQPADFSAGEIAFSPNSGEFVFSCGKKSFRASVKSVGIYNIQNAVAAISSAVMLGISPEKAAESVRKFNGVPGRMEYVENPLGIGIYIDFAHTPDSLDKLLSAVRIRTHGKIILVFGCGGNRDGSKRAEMGKIAVCKADTVIVTSDNPRFESPEKIISDITDGIGNSNKLFVEPDRKKAIKFALIFAEKGDTVVLAGKGHEKYQEINGIKYPFDEREILISLIKEINPQNKE